MKLMDVWAIFDSKEKKKATWSKKLDNFSRLYKVWKILQLGRTISKSFNRQN